MPHWVLDISIPKCDGPLGSFPGKYSKSEVQGSREFLVSVQKPTENRFVTVLQVFGEGKGPQCGTRLLDRANHNASFAYVSRFASFFFSLITIIENQSRTLVQRTDS